MGSVCQAHLVVMVHGVDGARGGWAVAAVRLAVDHAPPAPGAGGCGGGCCDGGLGQARVADVQWRYVPGQDAAGLHQVLARARTDGAVAVGLDCPIGLPTSGWRPCDLIAKRRLGRGSARVFLAPPRAVLAAPTYGDARAVARDLLGKGVSAQAYGIRRIVLTVDDALRGLTSVGSPPVVAGSGPGPADAVPDPIDAVPDPGGDETRRWAAAHVVEVHPELSFMAMSGRPPGEPLPAKRTPAGRQARIAALAAWTGDLDLDPPGGDDHLDALATAWTAWRWACGTAEVLGGERDEHGLPMRILV